MKRNIAIAVAALFALVIGVIAEETRVKVTITLVDEEERPVEGVLIKLGLLDSPKSRTTIEKRTDANGQIVGRGSARFGYGTRLKDPNFYDNGRFHSLFGESGEFEDRLYARQVLNPAPFFGRDVEFNPPVLAQEVGFDFLVGDWVAPIGVGQTADLMVIKREQRGEKRHHFSFEWDFRFPRDGDGLAVMEKDFRPCEFRSPRFAPEDGYEGKKRYFRRRQGLDNAPETNLRQGAHVDVGGYFLRIRTEKGPDGELKSAYYGKIYGEIPICTYLINAQPNDRNLEFDLKQNRIANLPEDQRPVDP